jgi:hypothetical protein
LRRTNGTTNEEPLFGFLSRDTTGNPYDDTTLTDTNGDSVPDFNPIRGHFNNSDNNPYFRYLLHQKLGNVLTARSNVYAIWITIGFFEVERTDIDEGNPDGYALKEELGTDTGEIKRHRMFMLVDRSIPVAFSRGENYNVHRAVVLNRVIE